MTKKIKCPFCGFEFEKDVEALYEEGQVYLVRGKERRKPEAKEDKRYVDVRCPNCNHEFEVEV